MSGVLIETNKDVRLLNRAIREQWPTSPEMKEKAIRDLERMLDSEDLEVQQWAIDQLRKIDAHNFAMAKVAIPQLHLHKHDHGAPGGQSEEQDIERWRQSIRQRAGVIERAGGDT